jgi:hypothetical protein
MNHGMSTAFDSRSLQGLATSRRRRLLIKELGSPPLGCQASDAFEETVVIAQTAGESAVEFAQRVLQRLASAEREARFFSFARFLAGVHYDPQTRAARRLLLLALATHLRSEAGRSSLLLEVAAAAGEQERHDLLTLLDQLVASKGRGELSVRLRFGLGSPSAGWTTRRVASELQARR